VFKKHNTGQTTQQQQLVEFFQSTVIFLKVQQLNNQQFSMLGYGGVWCSLSQVAMTGCRSQAKRAVFN
jgi:hypothetical protein